MEHVILSEAKEFLHSPSSPIEIAGYGSFGVAKRDPSTLLGVTNYRIAGLDSDVC